MSIDTFVLLVIACLAGNLSPGPSVLLVTSVSTARGFKAGVFAVLGMTAGAFVHVVLAASGVAAVLATMPVAFTIIQYLGAAYLVWLGVSLWRTDARARAAETVDRSYWSSSFLAGLLLTLADQKAILFYLGFFPAFIDLSSMTPADTLMIVVIAIVGVGGAKLVYAFLAARASVLFKNSRALQGINRLAACVMVAVGISLLLKAQGWI